MGDISLYSDAPAHKVVMLVSLLYHDALLWRLCSKYQGDTCVCVCVSI